MSRKRVSPVRPPPAVARPTPTNGRPKNRLLAALPADVFERLRPHLETIPIRVKQVLQKQGEALRYVYFPNGGVISITTVLQDGTTVEAATVGDEGDDPASKRSSRDDAIAPGETLMQVPDTDGERQCGGLPARAPRAWRLGRPYRTGHAGAHCPIDANDGVQRAARRPAALRPLATDDARPPCTKQDFTLSHEFLAVMLGVKRQSVSVVAGVLQEAGLIRYVHGRVTVRNRKGLEAAACECYPLIRAHFHGLTVTQGRIRTAIYRAVRASCAFIHSADGLGPVESFLRLTEPA